MPTCAGIDEKRAAVAWQLNVLVNQGRETFAPIRRDIKVVEEGEFFWGFSVHWPGQE